LRPTDPLKTTDPVNDALRGSTRRAFLIDGAGIVAAGSLAGGLLTSRRTWARAADLTEPAASQVEALRVLGRSSMRLPDSLPNPAIASATDTVPQIEHVVVLMMENHSYDNFLGMLGRGAGQVARGDGFALATDGVPNATNPYANGQLQRAFHMPTTCQVNDHPSQEWQASTSSTTTGPTRGL